jgi:hypothetical protein
VSLISAVQTYLKTYAGLASGAPLWVDYLGDKPVEYAVVEQPGQRVLETYLDGSTLREFPFLVRFAGWTADDAARVANAGWAETFAAWLESQTAAGTFPTLAAGQTGYLIEATLWGFLYEQGASESGIYQIACRLLYEQAA